MAKFLANENVPGDVVRALRQAGHDLVWVTEANAGADDATVLATALSQNRVLLTLDKDCGEMAFRQGRASSGGIILLRPRIRSVDYLVQLAVAVLSQSVTWEGNFAVAQEGKLRLVPLPD